MSMHCWLDGSDVVMATLLLRTLSASHPIGKSKIGYMSVYLMHAGRSCTSVRTLIGRNDDIG
jgi:hypothetical protein